MRHLHPQEVMELINKAVNKPILIDVREPFEMDVCSIAGSVNIPLNQIPTATEVLDPEQEYVLICHHGIRSRHAGIIMASQGFDNIVNLVGGIDAWACNVDPTMNRY